MTPIRTLQLQAILLAMLLFNAPYVEGAGESPTRAFSTNNNSDQLCGPLAVLKVLQECGREGELISIVQDCETNSAQVGASMLDLSDCLQKRGVSTASIWIGSDMRIEWRHPVILHLHESSENGGHYVVQLPCEERNHARVWFGPGREALISNAELATRRSGAVLLTAPHPIPHPTKAVTQIDSALWKPWVWAAVSLVVIAVHKYFRLFSQSEE